MRNEQNHFRGISQGCFLHEGNLHISYISSLGEFEVSKRLQRSRQNLEQSLGPIQSWGASCCEGLYILFGMSCYLRTWVFFWGDGWMASSKSIDSRFGFRWLQHWYDQTSLCIYFFANPLRNFWNTTVLLFVIDQWHVLSGDVAPNPNLPLDPFETISLEIGLLSTSTMLFLHQHPLTVNLIALFKNHPIFFLEKRLVNQPPSHVPPPGN